MTDPHESDVSQDVPGADPAAPAAGSDQDAPAGAPEVDGFEVDGLEAADVEADEEVLPADPAAAVQAELDERTGDLKRLQAEFLNYKRRVDRDRELIAENATYKALTPVIEVLDTVARAREAGEVEGGFKAVVDQLEQAVVKAGLVRFADPGDPFDPTLHEALSNMGPDPEVSVTTVKHVARAGYRIGDRVVRAAQVLVVEPADG
ncbi:nucleotide exchange factor GrpE [Nocardioides daphniae]|uniref:Protein GrpE n=1 Tax=Nocardioides daphniae TaxID=402297 RepID=A0A4P7U870_9ACTN|nr:nucleotide exchange factor GrpE [Nocardioides daphniae]QCC76290.1 nucleotide exchange factor GrpE [Nocardioides daphniae]GGD08261.1 protein GrpE [Nocardioides daphniae]